MAVNRTIWILPVLLAGACFFTACGYGGKDKARFDKAETLLSESKYELALLEYQYLAVEFPKSELLSKAGGRIKECEETIARVKEQEKEKETALRQQAVKEIIAKGGHRISYSEGWMGGSQGIRMALSGDVFASHPKLKEKYSTELKREAFIASDEYNKLRKNMETKAGQIRGSYVALVAKKASLSDYDVQRNGFAINFGGVIGSGTWSAYHPKCVEGFYIPNLPLRAVTNEYGTTIYQLDVPVNKEVGLEIENAKRNIVVEFIVSPKEAIETPAYEYTNITGDGVGKVSLTDRCISVSDSIMLIRNDKTKKVYYSVGF